YQNPTPFVAENKSYLVYEIYLSNFWHKPVTLTEFNIMGNDKLLPFTQNDLLSAIRNINVTNAKNVLLFQPGEVKVIFVWLAFDNDNLIPDQLNIDLSVNDKEQTYITKTIPLPIEKIPPVIVSSPLRGKNWLAVNGPSNASIHRRASLYNNGLPYYS